MSNPLNLTPGQRYVVVKPFTDYDHHVHPVGETFTFSRTNFLPYEDGLTLHVFLDDPEKELICRFQWRPEQQADLIENFTDHVSPVS
jgi:uncharacterized protein DUF3601